MTGEGRTRRGAATLVVGIVLAGCATGFDDPHPADVPSGDDAITPPDVADVTDIADVTDVDSDEGSVDGTPEASDTAVDLPDLDADLDTADLDTPPDDTGPPCTPTRIECNFGLECGLGPNGCPGGTLDCGECGGGETWCVILSPPRWRDRVWPCVQGAQDAHPEWFDPVLYRDTSSWLVLDASAVEYVSAVAACVNGLGAIALPDPNAPGNEIRARGEDDDVADNYLVRTYGTGRTAGRYTSSCTPAMF